MNGNKKVVVITGASGGIGEALATVFSMNEYKVVIAARDVVKLEHVRKNLEIRGGEIHSVICDVSREDDCKKLIDETVKRFGGIDVLINNAGISMRALFNELELEVIRRVMSVNFWGTVYCTKYAFPYLLKSKGSIVGISSIAGKKGLPGRTGYSASKFAMEGFLETIRTENLKKDIHVLIACPGFTATDIRMNALSEKGIPQGESPRTEDKMMKPERVAYLIFKAVKSRKRDLILTANGRIAVWLNKFFPSFSDKMVYNHMAKEENSPFK
jgi:dehydrogenase/reductase SDR family protein 7B